MRTKYAMCAVLVAALGFTEHARADTWTLTVYMNGNPNFLGQYETKDACEAGKQRELATRLMRQHTWREPSYASNRGDMLELQLKLARNEDSQRGFAQLGAEIGALRRSSICERRG
jgi:hypothetical protein